MHTFEHGPVLAFTRRLWPFGPIRKGRIHASWDLYTIPGVSDPIEPALLITAQAAYAVPL